jgi:uncharacterized membrane protein YcaP (DUF421 family)
MEYLDIVARSAIAVGFLLLITMVVGSKQISQLTFYDYAVGITIGSISGALAIDNSIPIWYSLIALSIFALCTIIISFITNKSIVMRRFFTGKPHILISEGTILKKGLSDAHLDLNDLLRELRSQGYFSVSDIQYAIFETNGKLSVLPKASARPLVTSDMNVPAEEQTLQANVIIDGKVLDGNLSAFGKSRFWLEEELKKQNIAPDAKILLATLTEGGALSVFIATDETKKRTVLQ